VVSSGADSAGGLKDSVVDEYLAHRTSVVRCTASLSRSYLRHDMAMTGLHYSLYGVRPELCPYLVSFLARDHMIGAKTCLLSTRVGKLPHPSQYLIPLQQHPHSHLPRLWRQRLHHVEGRCRPLADEKTHLLLSHN